jgi:8-oxo-dGTP pyrophosphatase MutT (NUDIX family)
MQKKRFKTHLSVYLILKEKDKILLSLRKNTGYKDGYWGLVSGHVEKEESSKQAMIREAKEEAGIILKPENLKFITVMHRKSERENIDIFFESDKWEGKIINKEPHKIEKLEFFSVSSMPSNLIDYIEKVFFEKNKYFELGWS